MLLLHTTASTRSFVQVTEQVTAAADGDCSSTLIRLLLAGADAG